MGLLSDDDGRFEDAYDIPYDPQEFDDVDMWVDGEGLGWEWSDLETSHIQAIISGLEHGKEYWGQHFKLKRAKRELAARLQERSVLPKPKEVL